jgi:hypothetical protein
METLSICFLGPMMITWKNRECAPYQSGVYDPRKIPGKILTPRRFMGFFQSGVFEFNHISSTEGVLQSRDDAR